jgi:hypothetical protein
MASPKTRFDVVAGRPYTTRDGEEKKQWINVGRMTEWDDGSYSIELHAIPTGNWFDGRLSVFEPKPKEGEQRQERSRPQRSAGDSTADDLPF